MVNLEGAYTTQECPVCNVVVGLDEDLVPVLISRGQDEEGYLLVFHGACRDALTDDQYEEYIAEGKIYYLLAFPELSKEYKC